MLTSDSRTPSGTLLGQSYVLGKPTIQPRQQGWIKAKWAQSETGRQAKFYSLTAAGRKQLEAEAADWNRLSTAINLVVSEV